MHQVNECPLCGSSSIEFLTDEGERFEFEKSYLCSNCGLIFLNPRMDKDELKEYYQDNRFSLDFRGNEEPDADKREKNYRKAGLRWDILKEHLPSSGKLLEIGCSSGEFLNFAEKQFDAYGLDPSTGYAQKTLGADSRVRVAEFPDESFKDEVTIFDVIVTFHTLEHVAGFRTFLAGVVDRLRSGGVFALEYPDVFFASHRATLAKSYFQRSHLYDFSVFNIQALLLEYGLATESMHFPDPAYPSDKNVLLICRLGKAIDVNYSQQHGVVDELRERLKGHFTKSVNISKGRKLKVVHIASQHINVGDGAISSAIRDKVTGITEVDIEFYGVDIVDFVNYGHRMLAENINQYKPDLVLVGGGGTIDGHKTRKETGTAFPMALDEIDKLDAPIAFVALGHNLFPDQEFYCIDELQQFVSYCNANDIPFSVRRDRSWERLSEVLDDKTLNHIQRVPDPGFFVPVDSKFSSPHYYPLAEKKVVIQLASDAYVHRLGSQDAYKKFIKIYADYVKWLLETYDCSVCIATHTGDDLWAATFLYEKDFPVQLRRIRTHATGVYHPVHAPRFFRSYLEADLVVGMRGHSVICGTGLGTPTIALSTHNKVHGFMDEINATEWCLHPREDDDLLNSMTSTTELLLNDPTKQIMRVAEATVGWRSELNSFLADCLRKVI